VIDIVVIGVIVVIDVVGDVVCDVLTRAGVVFGVGVTVIRCVVGVVVVYCSCVIMFSDVVIDDVDVVVVGVVVSIAVCRDVGYYIWYCWCCR